MYTDKYRLLIYMDQGSKYLVQCLQKETTLTGHEGCVSSVCTLYCVLEFKVHLIKILTRLASSCRWIVAHFNTRENQNEMLD